MAVMLNVVSKKTGMLKMELNCQSSQMPFSVAGNNEIIHSIFGVSKETFESSKTIFEFLAKINSKEISLYLASFKPEISSYISDRIRKISRLLLYKISEENISSKENERLSNKCLKITEKTKRIFLEYLKQLEEIQEQNTPPEHPIINKLDKMSLWAEKIKHLIEEAKSSYLEELSKEKLKFSIHEITTELIDLEHERESVKNNLAIFNLSESKKLEDLIYEKLEVCKQAIEKGESVKDKIDEIFLLLEKVNIKDRKKINFEVCYNLYDILEDNEIRKLAKNTNPMEIYSRIILQITKTLKEKNINKIILSINEILKLSDIFKIAGRKEEFLIYNISSINFFILANFLKNYFSQIEINNPKFMDEIYLPYLISEYIKHDELEKALKLVPNSHINVFKESVNVDFFEDYTYGKNLFKFLLMSYCESSQFKEIKKIKKDFFVLSDLRVPQLIDLILSEIIKSNYTSNKIELLEFIKDKELKKTIFEKMNPHKDFATSSFNTPIQNDESLNVQNDESLIKKMNNLDCFAENLIEAENLLDRIKNPPYVLDRKLKLIKWFKNPIWDSLIDPKFNESQLLLAKVPFSYSQIFIKEELKKMLERFKIPMSNTIEKEINKFLLDGEENLEKILNEIFVYCTQPNKMDIEQKYCLDELEELSFSDFTLSESEEEEVENREKEVDLESKNSQSPTEPNKEPLKFDPLLPGQKFDFESLSSLFKHLRKLEISRIKEAFTGLKERLQFENIEDEILISALDKHNLTDLYFEEV